MIEIELKLEVENFPNFKDYQCVKEKHIVDVYYDTSDYKLISTGNFLRNRNNSKVDFKLNLGDLTHTFCNETSFNYQGFKANKSLSKIFKNLGIPYYDNFNNFDEFLIVNNLSKLAVIDKNRKEYKIDDLIVSLDDARDIGKFIEIEMDLPDGTEFDKSKITSYMIDKLTSKNLLGSYKKVNIGYVELYLKRHNIEAYNLGLFKDWFKVYWLLLINI